MEMDIDDDFQEVPSFKRQKQDSSKTTATATQDDNCSDKSNVDHILRIMEEFPLLSSWKDHTYWTGFIQGETNLTRISVTVPNFPSSFKASVQGDSDSVKIFTSFQTIINQISDNTNGLLVDLLNEIKLGVNKYEENQAGDKNLASSSGMGTSNSDFFLTIFNELDIVGVENVESITKDFQELAMKYVDQLQRRHVIKYTIPPKYPQIPARVAVDLPPPSHGIDWPLKLSDVYERFKNEVDRYVVFWSVMDELDNQARLIDVQPKRADIHRRILLNQNIVVNLIFNPLCPKALPEIKFSGPEKSIYELDAMIDEHCKEWSEDKSILENLEDILQRDFLLKADIDDDNGEENINGSNEDIESLCVICYAFEFEGNVPSTNCECGSIYHDKCLSDLLVNDCSVKAKRFCVDCPVCGLELKVSKAHKVTW